MAVREIGVGVRVAATGQVYAGGCRLYGYCVNAGAGDYVLRDGGAGGTTKLDIAATAGSLGLFFSLAAPIRFNTDLHATLAAAGNITLLLEKG